MIEFQNFESKLPHLYLAEIPPTKFHFLYGFFIINGVEYKEHSPEFLEAFNQMRMWSTLSND